MTIKINPEYEALLQPLTEEELTLLEQGIRELGGLTSPILVDKSGTVLEGHNRHRLCLKHNITPWYKVIDLNGEDAKLWIIKHQLGRRNLTEYQRTVYALKYKEIIAEQAKDNQRNGRGALLANSPNPINTREEVAKIANVGSNTVGKVEYIEKNADEETKAKLRNGDKGTTINGTHKTLKAKEKATSKAASKKQSNGKTPVKPSSTDLPGRLKAVLNLSPGAQRRKSMLSLCKAIFVACIEDDKERLSAARELVNKIKGS